MKKWIRRLAEDHQSTLTAAMFGPDHLPFNSPTGGPQVSNYQTDRVEDTAGSWECKSVLV